MRISHNISITCFVVFAVVADTLTTFSFIQEDIILGLFLYYFIGLVISRLGSIVIEPFLKRINFLQHADYTNFIDASKTDNKIELFSEINNMYRTLSSLFLLLIVIRIYEEVAKVLPVIVKWNIEILTVGLFILFVLSYRKQTQYIKKRIDSALKKG